MTIMRFRWHRVVLTYKDGRKSTQWDSAIYPDEITVDNFVLWDGVVAVVHYADDEPVYRVYRDVDGRITTDRGR